MDRLAEGRPATHPRPQWRSHSVESTCPWWQRLCWWTAPAVAVAFVALLVWRMPEPPHQSPVRSGSTPVVLAGKPHRVDPGPNPIWVPDGKDFFPVGEFVGGHRYSMFSVRYGPASLVRLGSAALHEMAGLHYEISDLELCRPGPGGSGLHLTPPLGPLTIQEEPSSRDPKVSVRSMPFSFPIRYTREL
jgi:hypothetical protein